MGIDHTAIVVSDTEENLKFYRDLLGLRVAEESENYGTEQEHLNNVVGARLRAAKGPGIEFLEYLTPRDGRPTAEDARANNFIHWQTTLIVSSAEAAAEKLRAGKSQFVSSGVVEVSEKKLEFQKGVLVRDPDGHVMKVVEK